MKFSRRKLFQILGAALAGASAAPSLAQTLKDGSNHWWNGKILPIYPPPPLPPCPVMDEINRITLDELDRVFTGIPPLIFDDNVLDPIEWDKVNLQPGAILPNIEPAAPQVIGPCCRARLVSDRPVEPGEAVFWLNHPKYPFKRVDNEVLPSPEL